MCDYYNIIKYTFFCGASEGFWIDSVDGQSIGLDKTLESRRVRILFVKGKQNVSS